MIENYLYSIPKWKKILFGVLVTMFIFSLLSVKVNSGFISWLTGTITDNITDEIFTAVNQSAGSAVGSILDWVIGIFVEPFGPAFDTFEKNTNFGTVNAKDIIDGFAVSVGMFISTLIWGFSMFAYFFSGKITDSKDTPISLTARYVIAIAICYKQADIVDTFIGLMDDLHTSFTANAVSDALSQSGVFNIMAVEVDNEVSLLGVVLPSLAVFPGVGLIILILEIVLIWKLLKGFIQLYCEMISRYIVSIVLLLLFSAFGGTIVSNNTSQIFKSYLRTLLASFAVMLFNFMWFKLCFLAVLGGSSLDFLQYFFIIELLHFGLKFDGMLRSMGLGVATGGSRIASAVGGAGRNLANTLRNANDMRKAGGKLLTAAGIATGNQAAIKTGQLVGAGVEDIASGKFNNPNQAAINAAAYGAAGQKIPDNEISGKEAANIVGNALKNKNDQNAQDALNGLSNNKLKEAAQEMLGDGYKVSDARLQQQRGADGQMHTTLGVTAQKTNGGGSLADEQSASHNKTFNGQIGAAGTFDTGKQIGGDSDLTMNYGGSLKNGQKCSISEAEEIAGSDAAKALDGVKIGKEALTDGYIESCGRDANGDDCYRVYDDADNLVGSINGSEFTASSTSMKDEECSDALSGWKDQIAQDHPEFKDENGESTLGEFVQSDTNPGQYVATAHGSDDNGEYTQSFYATDKGQMPTAKIDANNVDSHQYECTNEDGNKVVFNVTPGRRVYQSESYGDAPSNQKYNKGNDEEEILNDPNPIDAMKKGGASKPQNRNNRNNRRK